MFKGDICAHYTKVDFTPLNLSSMWHVLFMKIKYLITLFILFSNIDLFIW